MHQKGSDGACDRIFAAGSAGSTTTLCNRARKRHRRDSPVEGRKGIKDAGAKTDVEGIALQRLTTYRLPRYIRALDNVHFNMTRYDDFDVLLFDLQQARKNALFLIVNFRRTHVLESLVGEMISGTQKEP